MTTLPPLVIPAVSPNGWGCWGHDAAVARMQRAVETGPSHAYIFSGPAHVGKATLAVEFARALMCAETMKLGTPCRRCSVCRRIERGVHPDVGRYGLASQALLDKGAASSTTLSIETVRSITAGLALRPMEGARRVVVVEDAETLQRPAQEAFLKTLEEPPGFAVLLLLATDSELLLETIRSRCQVISLQPVSMSTVSSCLVAAGVDGHHAAEIAQLSGGLPGWSFRAVNDPALLQAQADLVRAASEWIAAPTYDRVITAMQIADSFSRDRASVFRRLDALLAAWRGLLVENAGLSAWQDTGRVEPSENAAASVSVLGELVAAIQSVQRCQVDLEANVRPRLALESMVLEWPALTQ